MQVDSIKRNVGWDRPGHHWIRAGSGNALGGHHTCRSVFATSPQPLDLSSCLIDCFLKLPSHPISSMDLHDYQPCSAWGMKPANLFSPQHPPRPSPFSIHSFRAALRYVVSNSITPCRPHGLQAPLPGTRDALICSSAICISAPDPHPEPCR